MFTSPFGHPSAWGQQSGRGTGAALHSSGEERFGHWAPAMGKQEQTVVVPELQASFNSPPVGPGVLCCACRATWCGARHVNLREGIAIKCLNCTNSAAT